MVALTLFYIIALLLGAPLFVGAIAIVSTRNKVTAHNHTPALLFHSIPTLHSMGISHTTNKKFDILLEQIQQKEIKTETVAGTFRRISDKPSKKNTQQKTVAITFDDGFRDFYDNAFPCLLKRDMNATVFIVTGATNHSSQWDVYPTQPALTSNQIREISAEGFEIGSHSVTHADLTRLPFSYLEKELLESKAFLQDLLGKEVESISFPFGRWNDRVWKIAQDCGYKYASVYQGHRRAHNGMLPVTGVYSFDSVETTLSHLSPEGPTGFARARAAILPHFANGTPAWRFRDEYSIFARPFFSNTNG